MNLIDEKSLLFWLGMAVCVLLFSLLGMWINRLFLRHAHRKALLSLRRAQVPAENPLKPGFGKGYRQI